MLSDQAYEALARIDRGQILNSIHTVSRELITAGLACNDWGHLTLTEAGRRVVRGRRMAHHFAAEGTSDLWLHQDPFATPRASHLTLVEEASVPEPELEPIAPTIDDHTRALRCAGVATGRTGIEADSAWVIAFCDAWVNS
jgi:hypothetical protein